jgi:hypothetical protein
MMNWFAHPDAWKVSAALGVISLILLIFSTSVSGIAINFLSFWINGACAIFNYSIRDLVQKERRQHLIQLTIGE